MRILLTLIAGLAATLLVLGSLGLWFPPADSLALLRPACALCTLIGLLSARKRLIRWTFGTIAGVALLTTLATLAPSRPTNDLRLYSKNIWAFNADINALAQDILHSGARVVTLQEVSSRNEHILNLIAKGYPYQLICHGYVKIVVASADPIIDQKPCSRRFAAAQITANGQDIWVVSAHVPWHWPINARPTEDALTTTLQSLEGPVVIAGDFNSFPWTSRMHRIRAASRSKPAGPLFATFSRAELPLALPIDHALAPGGGTLTRRPLFGSDHHGLIADLSLSTPRTARVGGWANLWPSQTDAKRATRPALDRPAAQPSSLIFSFFGS